MENSPQKLHLDLFGVVLCDAKVGKKPETPSKKKPRVQAVDFDVDEAVKNLGEMPCLKQTWNNIYSWAYYRHKRLFQSSLPDDILKMQCRLVGQRVAAMLDI